MAYSKQNFQDGQILTAANLEKMENGIIAGQGAGAHNFLDNSDFRNPVNSLGRSGTYKGVKNFYTFVIDHWKTYSNRCTYTLSSAGLQIDNIDPNSQAGPQEEVSNPKRMKGKTYTLAVGYDDGNVACGNVKVPTGTLTSDQYLNAVIGSYTHPGLRLLIKSDYSIIEFQILISVGQRVTLKWAALYEGSYTADTLPAYQPKDKRVEMLNCGVPLAPHNILDNSDFIHPVNQRGKTSYTANGHTIDRWRDTSNAKTMVTEKGLDLQNNSTSDNAYWHQRIPAKALTSGKAYTMAVDIEGQVYCGYAVIDSTATTTFYSSNRLSLSCIGLTNSYWTIQITIPAKKTIGPFRWAALYEGAYDASTLPPYVPKGYATELAECKRYYYQSWVGSEFDKGYITREAMSTNTLSLIEFPTEMRIVPTITFYISVIDTGIVKDWATNSSVSVTQNYTSTKAFSVKSGDDNFTVGKTYYFHYSASADL